MYVKPKSLCKKIQGTRPYVHSSRLLYGANPQSINHCVKKILNEILHLRYHDCKHLFYQVDAVCMCIMYDISLVCCRLISHCIY